MTKYLDIFTDYGFKRIFGEEASKVILIDFLNALLPEKARIKDLRFKNTEKLGQTPINRNAIYDIYCENERGEKFIVELQKVKQKYYFDRTIFYSCLAVTEDAQKGDDWDWHVKPVYCISILGFPLPANTNDPEIVQLGSVKNQNGKEIHDRLNYIYIEMPKFNKAENELVTRLDKWLYFIKNLGTFQAIPAVFKNEVVFEAAILKAELAKMSDEDMAKYSSSLKDYINNIANINTAKEDGEAKGIAIGEAKGKAEKAIEMAKNCLADGMSIEKIARLTGLSEEEIRGIEV